jgi:hypothetical protein
MLHVAPISMPCTWQGDLGRSKFFKSSYCSLVSLSKFCLLTLSASFLATSFYLEAFARASYTFTMASKPNARVPTPREANVIPDQATPAPLGDKQSPVRQERKRSKIVAWDNPRK